MSDELDKLAETAMAGDKIDCPQCKTEFHIRPVARFQKQTIYMSLKYEGESMSLTTVAKTLLNMDNLLRAVAKDVGQRAHVFLQSVEQKEHELVFGLLVTDIKPMKSRSAMKEVPRG